MKKGILITILLLVAGLVLSSIAEITTLTDEERRLLIESRSATHENYKNNPNGCKTCHGGLGYTGGEEEELCYICHGQARKATPKYKRAKLSPIGATDIRRDFEKKFHHPVEKRGQHNVKETYPVIEPKKPRHAECLDCHNLHYSIPEIPYLGVNGIGKDGKFKKSARYEYEVCFKCHGADANKPVYQKNKLAQFNINNPSFHPVIDFGKNNYLPSLIAPLKPDSIIYCTSCHGSEIKGASKRLRGVHGSENDYILVLPYTRGEETLNPRFDLCYSCHHKDSILSNQSFKFHREHIEGVKSRKWKGTSCSTCHTPHGSVKYRFLIEFNPDYVTKDTQNNKLEFTPDAIFAGTCYLKCHDVEHAPKKYGASN